MLAHKRYENLCALAASGAASESDFDDLMVHVHDCSKCRRTLHDFMKVVADVLPEIAGTYRPLGITDHKAEEVGEGRQNGIATARTERQPTTVRPDVRKMFVLRRQSTIWTIGATITVSVLFCLALFSVYLRTHVSGPIPLPTPTQSVSPRPTPESQPSAVDAVRRVEELSNQLRKVQGRIAEIEAKAKVDEGTAKTATLEKTQLQSRLAVDDATIADLRTAGETSSAKMAQLRADLAEKDAELTAKIVEEKSVNARLLTLNNELNLERTRNSTLAQSQNLIAARNLHIVDVHDTDPDPKRQTAFGRILYAENKSLIFYAYDLADPGQKIFHVWGERVGDSKSVKSIGVFQSDDKTDNRWRLTFNDPHLLAQINSVFVTIESGKKPVTKPSENKVLFAYFGEKPNHP
jgi:TolA-binding protein